MVLDPSAVVAILFNEPESARLVRTIDEALFRRLSAAQLLELAIVVQTRYGDAGERELDLLLGRLHVEVYPVTVEQANLARYAYRQFGTGRHPAGLNFGDCFSYALARSYHEPFLFKGADFSKTDVLIASY